MDQQVIGALILGVFAIAGWWATGDLVGWYRRIAPALPDSRRLILFAFSVVCVVVSLAATWYGVAVTAAAADVDTAPLRPISWIAALAVFCIPPFLRMIVKRIAADERIDVTRRTEDRPATRDGE